MPKLQGPLFSLGAQGSIGKTLVYRKTRHGFTVQHWSQPTDPATAPQIQNRAYWAAARAAWADLTPTARQPWLDSAASWSLQPFALFAREWILQRIEPPEQPEIPAEKFTLP